MEAWDLLAKCVTKKFRNVTLQQGYSQFVGNPVRQLPSKMR